MGAVKRLDCKVTTVASRGDKVTPLLYLLGFPTPIIEILATLVVIFVVFSLYIGINFRAVEYNKSSDNFGSEVDN